MNVIKPGVLCAGVVLCLSMLPAFAEQPGDALSEAAVLASVCSGCHGDAAAAIPSLKGRSADDLAASFTAYKEASDGPSAMHRMAWGYSDDQIQAIAEFLAEEE